MGNWTEQENPDRLGFSIGIRVALIFLVVAIIGLMVWGFRVVTSPVKGEGDATIQKNSAANRIAARQEYQNIYEDIQGSDQRIDVYAETYAADKSSVNLTNLTGAKTYCLSRVRDYNALSKKYLSADFRPETLPAQIDMLDPAFDCKESSK
jgi:hypothetical protein